MAASSIPMARIGTRPGATPARPDNPSINEKGGRRPPFLHWICERLAAGFAVLHEARLCRAGELLAVGADGLGFAGVVVALLHERGFGRARERLAVLADRLGIAGRVLGEGRAGREGSDNGSQENPLHRGVSLDKEKWADWNLESGRNQAGRVQ